MLLDSLSFSSTIEETRVAPRKAAFTHSAVIVWNPAADQEDPLSANCWHHPQIGWCVGLPGCYGGDLSKAPLFPRGEVTHAFRTKEEGLGRSFALPTPHPCESVPSILNSAFLPLHAFARRVYRKSAFLGRHVHAIVLSALHKHDFRRLEIGLTFSTCPCNKLLH